MPTMTYDIQKLVSSKFPKLLREIPDKPKNLYLRGSLPSSPTKLLAVVGSRRYTQYGRDVCEKLISDLAPYDVAIVSGLALGMDGIAHKATLQAGLKAIAIPGSGLDDSVLYPRTNYSLAKQILNSGGALLSEYHPTQRAALYTFAQRNRIMAGISHGVLIIEATERSGTLITARLAMEYNREVMTVPGSIYNTSTFGPHSLIKAGATPVTEVADILEALNIKENKNVPRRNLENLSETEESLYELLGEPQDKEELFDKIKAPIHEINITLSAMEIKGLIQERLGKIHRL